jgi:hypothetical protein
MNSVDFKKFAYEFFLLHDMACPYQAMAGRAFNIWQRLLRQFFDKRCHFDGSLTEMCMDVLIKKGTEYSTDDDKLHNFKKAAQISGETPVHCAEMFQLKHTTSIQDILDGRLIPTQEMLNEKFVDYINYCVLIAALKHEEKSLTTNNQPTT